MSRLTTLNRRAAAMAVIMSATLNAQVLMLDFGPTTTTGASLTNSPYHSENPEFTDSGWNKLSTADVSSGLVFSNGSPASGLPASDVTLNLGASSSTTSVDLAITPSGSTLAGGVIFAGVYANTSVARDGIFAGTNASGLVSIGLQVGGLGAGTYEVYITGRNTNISATHTQNFFVSKASVAGDFTYDAYPTKPLNYPSGTDSATADWTENTNYVKFSVTLTAGEFLNIAARGGTGDPRGFLNSVQIVNTTAIPESAHAGALCGLGAMAFVTLRRRR